jgi:hypothetical protein
VADRGRSRGDLGRPFAARRDSTYTIDRLLLHICGPTPRHAPPASALLHHLVDETTTEAAFAALAGGLFKAPDEVALRRELRAAADAPPIQPPPLPWWAEYGTSMGPDGAPPPIFGTETLDLGDDPAAWPPVTVAAYSIGDDPPTVLVEVSGSGSPTHVEPWQARRMATALLVAADLVDQVRAGGGS